MAYLYSQTGGYDTANGTSLDAVTLPEHAANDLLLMSITDSSGTATISATGWTVIGTQAAANSQRTVLLYKVAASSSETDPVPAVASGASCAWCVMCIRGADTVNPIDGSAKADWNAVSSFSSAALTTTTNNCMVVYVAGSDNSTSNTPRMYGDPNEQFPVASLGGSAAMLIVGYRNLATAGAAATVTWYHDVATEGGTVWTVAIKDAGSAAMGPQYADCLDLVERYSYNNNTLTWAAPNSEATLTSIAGISMSSITSALGVQSFSANGWWNPFTSLSSTESTANLWVGGIHARTGGAIDLENKTCAVSICQSGGPASTRVGSYGLITVLMDASGNWAAYQLQSKKVSTASLPVTAYFIPGVTTTFENSASLPNFAAITKIGHFMHRIGSSVTVGANYIGNFVAFKQKITGGSVTRPFNPTKYVPARQNTFFGSDFSTTQGSSQLLYKSSIQLGDGGTTASYMDIQGASFETPLAYANTASKYRWNCPAGYAGITLYGGASDTYKFRDCVLSVASKQTFTIHASHNTGATVSFDGSVWVGWGFVWKTGVSASKAAFSSGYQFDLKGGSLTSCVFSGCKETSGAALKASNGASITGCSVTKGSETYAIELTDAGSYDLSNTTFSGYTTDLNISATTGTVTISLARGQAHPTTTTAGATIAWAQPQNTASVTGIVAGSRMQIYNVTTDTEIVNQVVAGTSYSANYDEGAGYSEDDVIRVRLTKVSGATGHHPFETTAVATSYGWSLLADQKLDALYNSIGIDGSSVTEFSADYPTVHIDIADPDGTTSVQRLYAFFHYIETTEDGIRNWFEGLEADDIENFQIYTDTIDLKLDNTNVSPVVVTGGRLYRSDGTTVIAATSGSIQMDPGKVYAVETGVSGLTPSESAQLMGLPSASTTAGAVRTELSTELGRIDAAISTRLASASYTAPDSAATIATAVGSREVETGFTADELLRLNSAVLLGKTTGQPTAPVFRDVNDTANRVTATVDTNGNRSGITLNP